MIHRLVIAAVAALAASTAFAGPPLYKLTMIPATGGKTTYIQSYAVNDQGHMAAYRIGTSDDSYGILMPDGTFIDEVPPAGELNYALIAINDADDGIGNSLDGRAFIWSPSLGWEWIQAPGGLGAVQATSINGRGVVVGSVATPRGPRPFVWRRGMPTLKIVGDGRPAGAVDINDRNQVLVSYVDENTGGQLAAGVIHTDGRVVPIETARPHQILQPVQINLQGAVALSGYQSLEWQAWAWTPSRGFELPGSIVSVAIGVDDLNNLVEFRDGGGVAPYYLVGRDYAAAPILSLLTPDSYVPDFTSGLSRPSRNGTLASTTNGGVLLFTPVAR